MRDEVQKQVDRIVEQADIWANEGPESQIEHITNSTIFGIEIECFVPREHTEEVSEVSTGSINIRGLAGDILSGTYSNEQLCEAFNVNEEVIEALLEDATRESIVRFIENFNRHAYVRASRLYDVLNNRKYKTKLKYDRPTALSLVASKYPNWQWKRDGSVSGSSDEVVSPKLKGRSGLIEIGAVLKTLNSCGFSVDNSCGGHTNLSYRNGVGHYTAPLALLALWGSVEAPLHERLSNFRGDIDLAHWVSAKYDISNIVDRLENTKALNILNSLGDNPTQKYHSLSMRNYANSRVEFRTWKGSLDYKTWAAQIGFGEFVLQCAADLSRDIAKARKAYVKKESNNGVKRTITNKQFKEWGTTENCDCPECVEVREKYPNDFKEYIKTNVSRTGNNWVAGGYETEDDV